MCAPTVETNNTGSGGSVDSHKQQQQQQLPPQQQQHHHHHQSSSRASKSSSPSPTTSMVVSSSPILRHRPSSTSSESSEGSSSTSTSTSTTGSTSSSESTLLLRSISSGSMMSIANENGRTYDLCHNNNASSSSSSTHSETTSFSDVFLQIGIGLVISSLVTIFSFYFPFWFTPELAHYTYRVAYWKYDPHQDSYFDNTPWTYCTDYILAICMIYAAFTIQTRYTTQKTKDAKKQKEPSSVTTRTAPTATAPTALSSSSSSSSSSMTLQLDDTNLESALFRSRGLLYMYMISVLAGGISHQYITTYDQLNSNTFRIIWSICVGTVAAASGFMGSAGTSYLKQYQLVRITKQAINYNEMNQKKNDVWIVPDWFWVSYSTLTTVTVLLGYFSFQRPACDIFLAGITQFPSTFYIMYILLLELGSCPNQKNVIGIDGEVREIEEDEKVVFLQKEDTIDHDILPSKTFRYLGCFAFILNAPLLPMYPILVTTFPEPAVNTFLHTWLLTTWSLQAYTMKTVISSLESAYYNTNKSSIIDNNDEMVNKKNS